MYFEQVWTYFKLLFTLFPKFKEHILPKIINFDLISRVWARIDLKISFYVII